MTDTSSDHISQDSPPYLQVRWKNFRGFADTQWRELRNLTLLIGPNHAGKTSLLLPLLALRQTLESRDHHLQLMLRGDLADLGSFSDMARDRDNSHEVSFGLRFHFHGEVEPPASEKNQLDGPGVLNLTYQARPDGSPLLARYQVNDWNDRLMFERVLNDTGRYGLRGSNFSEARMVSRAENPGDEAARKYIRNQQPHYFLFEGEDALSAALREIRRVQERSRGKSLREEFEPSEAVLAYAGASQYAADQVRAMLRAVRFVGPLRSKPQRIYELSDESPFGVGIDGAQAPEFLFKADDATKDQINEVLGRFAPRVTIEFAQYKRERAFSLLLRTPGGPRVNFADAGFGYSQLLPLLVELSALRPTSHLIMEQPEIHLNPAIHGTFADVLMERAEKGPRIVVETHSEHVLLRVRRRIAEGKFDPQRLSLYYVQAGERNETEIRRINVDERGQIEADEWPPGFFADDIQDAVALTKASIR